jgi:type IV pilus assembly protein PilM
VGLDIEPGSVSACEVDVDGGLRISRVASVALEPHVVREGEVADVEALSTALRQLFREHKLDRRVRVGVANQRIVVRTLDVPPVDDPKVLETAVRFQAQDELPMRLEEAVIDFHALGVEETPEGPRQRVLLVAARRQLIENLVAAVRGAGLKPEGVDLSAFALVRAVGYDDEPTLYLSVGGLTNLAIAEAGTILFTRVSGSGFEGMAQMLAERRGIPLDAARQSLVDVGLDKEIEPGDEESALPARSVLVEGIRRIAGEARASMDFHHAARSGAEPIARAVLAGSVLAVPGFADALGAELGVPVVAATLGADADIDGGRYAVAAGLAVEEAA